MHLFWPILLILSQLTWAQEAVIDKDYASALLAKEIEADLLVILTGVPQVAINFGKDNQELLNQMNKKQQ